MSKEEPTLANMRCTCMSFEPNCFTGSCRKCGFPPKEKPNEETLEDKLQSLVVKWHQRQLHYQDVAEDNITHEHTNRKFTYKAMATRDCWKELLTLLNESKDE